MIAWKLKHWRVVGVAAAFSVAACGGEGGETGASGGEGGEAGEGGDVVAPPTPAPSAEAPAPAAGGEAGEAGAQTAYAGLEGDQRIALRLHHLLGFVLAAERALQDNNVQPMDAAILVQQGVLEVYDAAPTEFGTLNADVIRAAADMELPRDQLTQRLNAAKAEIARASGALDDDAAITVARLVDISTGLYQLVIQQDFVDPIEYQHSMGAALAARAALREAQSDLRGRDAGAYTEANRELDRFVALWPSATAPEAPTPYNQLLAAGSRIRFALSPYL
ncbi:hypothetical protein [Vitreimonas flagellata]|uniref:hypothetical protein n=1 Tax=Vitreimonas flagellata TaxID=2560861 RepID=UPI001074E788|nr:hypothetical protein [Vitreimonas flagellata]